jgi:hypothetical protein
LFLVLAQALEVCRHSACSMRVLCMHLVVPALACACACVHVLCLSCACLASACFMLVLCMRLACRLAYACDCVHVLCLLCACPWLPHASRLFGACVWLFLLVLLMLLVHLILARARPCCLHSWTRCVLLVGWDPPARTTTRGGIVPSRGVILVWSRSGGGSWLGVVSRGFCGG